MRKRREGDERERKREGEGVIVSLYEVRVFVCNINTLYACVC